MHQEHQIIGRVYAAKEDSLQADDLIRDYTPFIRSETRKGLSKSTLDKEDGFSIGMMAFYEAVQGYDREKGSFLKYASMLIRSRLIDYQRRERRHSGQISIDEPQGESEITLADTLADEHNDIQSSTDLEATQQEIAELSSVMKAFCVSFSDVADHSPKQARTMAACKQVIQYAIAHRELLDELLDSKKLPLAKLVEGTGVERKTLERHRKYILAMFLIQTNGYEIIRGHLRRMLTKKEGASA